jgi:hypothetical protein
MPDRTFVDAMIDHIPPRITALTLGTFKRSAEEAYHLDTLGDLVGKPPPPPPLLPEPSPELIRQLWSASLSDAAVTFLWELADAVPDHHFTCSQENIAAVVARVDREELARETGMSQADLGLVLPAMGHALREIVDATPSGVREVEIDRQIVLLRKAPQQQVAAHLRR